MGFMRTEFILFIGVGPYSNQYWPLSTEEANMGTIFSLFKSIRVIWTISKGLKFTHIPLIDFKKDFPLPILPFLTLFL